MKTALGQIIVCPRFQSSPPIFLAVLVRNDHHWQCFQRRILSDHCYQLNAIHARHVYVADDQIVMTVADTVPAIHSVYSHLYVVAAVIQKLSLQLANGQGVVHYQDAFLFLGSISRTVLLDLGQSPSRSEFFDRDVLNLPHRQSKRVSRLPSRNPH